MDSSQLIIWIGHILKVDYGVAHTRVALGTEGETVTTYGYRLHLLEMHDGRSRATAPLDDLKFVGVTHDAYDELFAELECLVDEVFIGSATYKRTPELEAQKDLEAADTKKMHPYLVVRSVTKLNRRIDVGVEYGKENDFESLLSRDGQPPLALSGRAPVRKYSVSFHVPTSGTSAVMVSITKGRSYIGEALVNRLRVQNQRAAASFNAQGELVEEKWLRWSAKPLFDPGRLQTVIAEAKNHALTLKAHGLKQSGAQDSGTLRITEQGIPLTRASDLVEVMRKWWDRRADGDKDSRSIQGARELGALVSADIRDVEYEDGEISFVENGKTQTISPNTIERMFIYPLGDMLPPTDRWQATVATKLKGIIPALRIELDLTESP